MDLGLVLGVLAALLGLWAVLLVLFWILRPNGVSVRELLGVVPDILRLMRSLVADRSAPLDVRLVLAWLVSPIDLIPEFIPGLGPLDDVIVAVVAFRYVRRRSASTICAHAGADQVIASPCCSESSVLANRLLVALDGRQNGTKIASRRYDVVRNALTLDDQLIRHADYRLRARLGSAAHMVVHVTERRS